MRTERNPFVQPRSQSTVQPERKAQYNYHQLLNTRSVNITTHFSNELTQPLMATRNGVDTLCRILYCEGATR